MVKQTNSRSGTGRPLQTCFCRKEDEPTLGPKSKEDDAFSSEGQENGWWPCNGGIPLFRNKEQRHQKPS